MMMMKKHSLMAKKGFFSSSSSSAPAQQWYKVLKEAYARFASQRLMRQCEVNPECGRKLCGFMTRTETWKARLNHYSGHPLVTRVFVREDKALMKEACEVFTETYTGTVFAAALGLWGLGVNQAMRIYDRNQVEKSFRIIERRLISLSLVVENLRFKWYMANLAGETMVRNMRARERAKEREMAKERERAKEKERAKKKEKKSI